MNIPKAVILDMDGVITQTVKLHKSAWKQMFNEFLINQAGDQKLMDDEDYLLYVDGKPRYKGVQSFLESRSIELPFGDAKDTPDKKTVCGLGNRKNELFIQSLKEKGAKKFDDAIEKIKFWRQKGLKTAVVTSSKNGKLVLETAGISDLFHARVDGVTATERKLKGKPNPDIFLEAAKMLNLSPDSCAVFEDAISGVQAGSAGNFGLVVGVARSGNRKELSENGADVVIESFNEIDLFTNDEITAYYAIPAPSLLSDFSNFNNKLKKREPVLFLDYDGTLTPIVKKPEDALISEEMKSVLKMCAEKFRVAAVSGRDMDDLKDKVKLDELIYAGSHGFRISGPDGLYKEHDKTDEIIPKLNQIEKQLEDIFPTIDPGVQIDRKRYAIGVHYRNADDKNVPAITRKVDEVIEEHEGFKKSGGKKIFEIKPDVDWHKGKAVLWILKTLGLDNYEKYVPIYVGDDVTDEDAFTAIKDFGIGILVGAHGDSTDARFFLKNVYQVRVFLQQLAHNAN